MIEAVCDCGAVRIELAQAPELVRDCQCDGCQRMGVLWAYYHPRQVRVSAAPGALRAHQRATQTQDFFFCGTCGCTTHWTSHDPDNDNMGVNARLLAPEVRAAAVLRVTAGP